MYTRKLHVAAGSFLVKHAEPICLQAYLGTCVGVAVFDPEARVGGLIHLLLPEPVSMQNTFQPEKYASRGMPLFLQALAGAGANPRRLHACMAGGALVGPISSQDLALDVGGRTADIARSILTDAGITIGQSETGGFFTCCLSLDMHSGQCRIEPAGHDHHRTEAPPRTPTRQEIERLVDTIHPIPQIALKVMRIINQDGYDIAAIVEQVRKDQVIGAQILRLCNSPLIAPRQPVESIDHALVLIGPGMLQKFVIAAALEGFFDQVGIGYSLCKGGLYHHSMGTAIIAEHLAQITDRVRPPLAYTAGLLHDIGKVLLDQFIAGAYPLFYRTLQEGKEDMLSAERRLLSMDHTQAGALLARRWKLPQVIAEVIEQHHRPRDQAGDNALISIVSLAEMLMYRFNAGLELERLNPEDIEGHLAALGLAPQDLAGLVDQMPSQVFSAAPEMGLIPSAERR